MNQLHSKELDALHELLPDGRRAMADRVRNPKRRAELIGSGTMIRLLMEAYGIGSEPECNAFGKPDFAEVHFSLSHSCGVLALAIADVPVGVDIEHVRPFPEAVARKVGIPAGSAEEMIRCWTMKEAAAKQIGSGLRDLTVIREEEFTYLSHLLKFDKEGYVITMALPKYSITDNSRKSVDFEGLGKDAKEAERSVYEGLYEGLGKLFFTPDAVII